MPISAHQQSRGRGRPFKSQDEREAMKMHIAETAQRLFQEEGYALVSMRRLAKEAGCSPMTLYKYYDGKIAILQTLWAVVFKDLFDQLRAQLNNEPDAKQRMRIACNHYVGYWVRHPEHYRMVFMAEGVSQSEVSLFVNGMEVGTGFDLLLQIITEGLNKVGDGMLEKTAIDLVMGSLHGIAHNHITISGYPWSDPAAMIDMLIDNLS
ncbi:MAG: TetR/AcrR family transcriptional regulator [Parasphingorhabdus sp.]|uniref:TetR/AcrR family transcriptional regulator n=1 Tax=Parasphingorhabdus sp. TaxID=2709688 RepID=UPI0032977C8F